MTKKVIIFLLAFIIIFSSRIFLVYAASAHLELSPSSGVISTTGTDIAVKIDTGGQETKSAKAVINFDATKLEVISVQAGTFFDEVSHNIYNSTGQVIINANLSLGSSLESKTGIGTLATMTIKAKISSNTGNLTFSCTEGSSTDSGINDTTAIDIIDCTANVNGSYNLGFNSTSSPSPSLSPVPTPSALPVAGNTGPTTTILIFSLSFIFLSFPLFLITRQS